MDTLYFHEHYENSDHERITVILQFEPKWNYYRCQITVDYKVSYANFYSSVVCCSAGGDTPKQAYKNAYALARQQRKDLT